MTTVQTEVPEERGIFQTVIETVADAEGTSPTELSPPLFEAVDPDALEALFASGRAPGKIVFNYNNYEVSVFCGEYVSVEDHGR